MRASWRARVLSVCRQIHTTVRSGGTDELTLKLLPIVCHCPVQRSGHGHVRTVQLKASVEWCLSYGHEVGRRCLERHAIERVILHVRWLLRLSIIHMGLWLLKAPVPQEVL